MNSKLKYAAAVLLLQGLIVSYATAAQAFTLWSTWNYKMTVTVKTPEGIKTGSSVYKVTEGLLPNETYRGEAVIVDLGKRGMLLAAMNGVDGYSDYEFIITHNVFPLRGKTAAGKEVHLEVEQYPLLVYFRDAKDPKSVERVLEVSSNGKWPRHLSLTADHTEEIFGKGVKIEDVTLAVTDDPMTTGIVRFLPWLPNYYDTNLNGNPLFGNEDLANSLASGAFSTEESPHGK